MIDNSSPVVDNPVGAKVNPSKGSTPVLPEMILFCNKTNFLFISPMSLPKMFLLKLFALSKAFNF
jgi:hypothetical protein